MRLIAEWLALLVLASILVVALQAAAIPAALLLGPMIAAIIVAVSGSRARLPRTMPIVAQAVLGCLIAAALNSELLHVMAAHWPLFVGFSIATMLIIGALGLLITRMGWLPGTTAIWGLSPGAASAMILLADDHGADKRMVAMMQYSRIALVALAAILVANTLGHPDMPIHASASNGIASNWLILPSYPSLVATLVLAASGALIAIYSRKLIAALFIPAIAGAILQSTGLISIDVPPLLASLAFSTVGVYVGLSFTRETLIHSLRVLPAMLLAIFAMIAVCGLLSLLLIVLLSGTDPLTAYLALSPGGIDAAVIIAAHTEVSLPLILAAQFVRLPFAMAGAPALAKWLTRRYQQRSR